MQMRADDMVKVVTTASAGMTPLDALLKRAQGFARSDYAFRIRQYEVFKQAIRKLNFSVSEYDAAIRRLAEVLRV